MEYLKTINDYRVSSGITIKALAAKIGMDEDSLSKTLRGTRKMTAEELIAISYTFGISLEEYSTKSKKLLEK